MSSAIELPYFFHKVSGRKFDELFEVFFEINPGLRFIEGRVAISYVAVAQSPGDESLRIALTLRDAMKRVELEDQQLADRVDWFIRDYLLVGSLVSEGEKGQACTIDGAAGSVSVSPYGFAVVLSALLRAGAIDGYMAEEAAGDRALPLVDVADQDRARSALEALVVGSDGYRTFHEDHTSGAREHAQLEQVLQAI